MRNPLSVKANGMTNMSKTRADVDSNSSSTMPTAYKTRKSRVSIALSCDVDTERKVPPKMKWAPARSWHFRIVRPSSSRTTLRPRETTRSMKKDSEFRPASRIATTKRKTVDVVPFPWALR